MFLHHFAANKEQKKGKNAIQANAGSHPKAGLTPCKKGKKLEDLGNKTHQPPCTQAGSTHTHTLHPRSLTPPTLTHSACALAPTHYTPICHCCLEHKRSRANPALRSWAPRVPNLGYQLLWFLLLDVKNLQ